MLAAEEIAYRAAVAAEFSGRQLEGILRAVPLPFSGTKAEQARRIARHGDGGADGRPSRQQLVYLAAASGRQGIVLPVGVVQSKTRASHWLTEHGDWRGRRQ